MLTRASFPPDFLWGVATAAQQIEGSPPADGRGDSIWDVFSRVPGRIADGTTPEVACDHYRRWENDLGLLADLGLNAYRFSVSWPRVLPEGRGRPNPRGLDFYQRLVDGLLGARHHAPGDHLARRPSAGARGSRRLAQPGHDWLVHRLCRYPVPHVGRPRAPLDHAQRAQLLSLPGAGHRQLRAGKGRLQTCLPGHPQRAGSAWLGGAGVSRRRSAGQHRHHHEHRPLVAGNRQP